MATVFLVCLLVGAIVFGVQIVLGLFGVGAEAVLDVDLGEGGAASTEDGLELLSVRTVSAALLTFGACGLALDTFLWSGLAALIALPPALAAALATAWLTRQMMKLESDGSIDLGNAVGTIGSVYLTIPAHASRDGDGPAPESSGLVHVTVQGRTIEVRAFTREGTSLPTGSSVVVVAAEGDTVEVVPAPLIEGVR